MNILFFSMIINFLVIEDTSNMPKNPMVLPRVSLNKEEETILIGNKIKPQNKYS